MSTMTDSCDAQGQSILNNDVKSCTTTSICGRSSTNSSCGSSTRGKRKRSRQKNPLTVADVYDIAADIGMFWHYKNIVYLKVDMPKIEFIPISTLQK